MVQLLCKTANFTHVIGAKPRAVIVQIIFDSFKDNSFWGNYAQIGHLVQKLLLKAYMPKYKCELHLFYQTFIRKIVGEIDYAGTNIASRNGQNHQMMAFLKTAMKLCLN